MLCYERERTVKDEMLEMRDEHVTSRVHLAARRTGSILLRKRERAFPYE